MKEWWIKFMAWTVFGVSWIVLIGLKIAKPEMSLKVPLIITIILSLASLIAVFGKNFAKLSKKDEIPDPITKEQLIEKVKEVFKEKWNNVKIENGIEWTKSKTINKNIIYALKVNLDINEESYILIINANYPERIPTILKSDARPSEIEKEMNNIASTPEDEPNIEITEEAVDNFGRPVRKTQTITQNKKEEKKEEVV